METLAKKLKLQSLVDFIAETMAIKKLIHERNGHQPESTKHIIELSVRDPWDTPPGKEKI